MKVSRDESRVAEDSMAASDSFAAPPARQEPCPHRAQVAHQESAEEQCLARVLTLDVKGERNQGPPGEEFDDGRGQEPPIADDAATVGLTCGTGAPELVIDAFI